MEGDRSREANVENEQRRDRIGLDSERKERRREESYLLSPQLPSFHFLGSYQPADIACSFYSLSFAL